MTSHVAWLVLDDGTAFRGEAFGASTTIDGEVVFNTSMSGYPELLTDPSYRRQLLTLTVPEVGNYGVCDRDFESDRIQAAGLIVRRVSTVVSNWRSDRFVPCPPSRRRLRLRHEEEHGALARAQGLQGHGRSSQHHCRRGARALA
jgi:hypothetical protein